MKRTFLVNTTCFVCSQIRLTVLSLCECKLVFCPVLRRVYVGRFIVRSQKTQILIGQYMPYENKG